MAILGIWKKSICNHMYWSSASTSEDTPNRGQVVKEKWLSITNHVADIHDGHGAKFQKCAHGPLEGRAWMKKGNFRPELLLNLTKSYIFVS